MYTERCKWDVGRYQSQHSFVYEYGRSLIPEALRYPARRILDIGCGTGELTQALYEGVECVSLRPDLISADNWSRRPPTFIGLDYDLNMVQQARAQYPHLTFVHGDARTFHVEQLRTGDVTPPPDETDLRMDLIFSNAALHWIPPVDANRAIQNLAEALKPGGHLVIEMGGKGNVQLITEACIAEIGQQIDQIWYFPGISEFATLCETHDIEVTSALLYDRPTPLPDGKNGLRNWIRMFGKYYLDQIKATKGDVDCVTREEDCLERIEDRVRLKLFNGTDWIADYRRLRIHGRKKSAD